MMNTRGSFVVDYDSSDAFWRFDTDGSVLASATFVEIVSIKFCVMLITMIISVVLVEVESIRFGVTLYCTSLCCVMVEIVCLSFGVTLMALCCL